MTQSQPQVRYWPPERIEQLKALAADGLSASQIAGKLGGVSRNAVIGKLHRMNLRGLARAPGQRYSPEETAARKRVKDAQLGQARAARWAKHAARAVSKPLPPPADTGEPAPLGEPMFLAARDECKWIHGDPLHSQWRMCCHPVYARHPYCAHHFLRTRQPKGNA